MIRLLLAAVAAVTITGSAFAFPYHHGYPQPHQSAFDRCVAGRLHYRHTVRDARWFCRYLRH